MTRRGASLALLKAFSKKSKWNERKKAKKQSAVLSSRIRKAIFEFLCRHPCCGAVQIADKFGISIPTVQWHLRKLCEAGYLSSKKWHRKTVFYPDKLLLPEDIPLFIFLSQQKKAGIYREICSSPGSTVDELAVSHNMHSESVRAILSEMLKFNLVSEVRDGRQKRYYPTDSLEDRHENTRKNWKVFRDSLIQKLTEERLFPELKRSTPESSLIEIKIGGKMVELNIKTAPHRTFLE